MTIYFINLGLLILYAFIFNLFGKKNKRFLEFIVFMQLFTLTSLRAPNVGSDTQVYINLFQRTKQFSFWDFSYSRHEVGYILLNKLLQFIDNNQVFIAILAFIPLFLILKFIFKESKIPWLSVYLFITLGFYTNSFNLLRQIIAMSIILHSYKYLKEDNKIRFFMIVLLASLFHITAISFLIVFFIRYNKIKIKNFVLYLLAGISILIFSRKILIFMLKFFSSIDYEIESGGGYALLLVFILIMFVALIFNKSIIKNDDKNIILYNILILTIAIQLLALEFSLFTRVTSYFSIFLIIFIPEILAGIKDVQIRIIGIMTIVILTAVQYYFALNVDLSSIVPYQLFFK